MMRMVLYDSQMSLPVISVRCCSQLGKWPDPQLFTRIMRVVSHSAWHMMCVNHWAAPVLITPPPPGPTVFPRDAYCLPIPHQPGQQGVDVVGSGRVRAQRRRCHKRSCLSPVLAPVMGSICAKAGSDGLAKDHVPYKGRKEAMGLFNVCAALGLGQLIIAPSPTQGCGSQTGRPGFKSMCPPFLTLCFSIC